jgi:hypothetical protein
MELFTNKGQGLNQKKYWWLMPLEERRTKIYKLWHANPHGKGKYKYIYIYIYIFFLFNTQ